MNHFIKIHMAMVTYALLLSFAFLSCGGKKTSVSSVITFSQIIRKVCKADTTQSYAVYLPASYTNQKKWPIIYVFDSHGGGQFAVEHFKDAAERYSYVIVGSNNSKNGMQAMDHILEALVNDVQAEYSVDLNRQYAAGFSGGGRVASFLAMKTGKIKGIITCGAGVTDLKKQPSVGKFDIYGIAGREDFNYDEVMAIAQQFDRTDWRYMAIGFNGGHEWPSAYNISKAVLWFQFNAMKDGLIAKNDPLIEQEFDSTIIRVKTDLSKKQFIMAFNECKEGIASLDGLTGIKKLNKKLQSIQDMDEYRSEKQKETQLRYTEDQMRNEYIDGFTSRDLTWWTNALENLSESIANEPDLPTKQMLKRMKGFLGIVCYSFTSSALKGKNMAMIEKCIDIYQIVEPKNPDSYFYKAQLLQMKNKPDEAAEAIKRAIELGYTDIEKIQATFSKKVLQSGNF